MLEKLLNQMNELERKDAEASLQRVRDLLLSTYDGATERGIKSLFLTNGGGLISVLTYFHASPKENSHLIWSFYLFTTGLC
jgi:hypothetical protein